MSNKHKHYDMIVAKAENMDLVVFCKVDELPWQERKNQSLMEFGEKFKYFLCLPQHKDTCLHWLNGGEAQQKPINGDNWVTSADVKKVSWMSWTSFMKDELKFRIKPKKEKRWIAALPNGRVSGWHDGDREALEGQYNKDVGWQFIEIEVLVK
ncbi:hypothetical protein NVP1155O_34 [Vibrio phage 1.155.O._10N.222.55.B3]|nr:hypothetical protein NVP1155O_34 [Vibrio phage 1.155.O._10N.222.55.B3]